MHLHRVFGVALSVLLLTAVVSGQERQVQVQSRTSIYQQPGTAGGTDNRVLPVPLDHTGVGDWRFLNPRNPPFLEPDTDVEFVNRTMNRTIEVAIPVVVDLTLPEFSGPLGSVGQPTGSQVRLAFDPIVARLNATGRGADAQRVATIANDLRSYLDRVNVLVHEREALGNFNPRDALAMQGREVLDALGRSAAADATKLQRWLEDVRRAHDEYLHKLAADPNQYPIFETPPGQPCPQLTDVQVAALSPEDQLEYAICRLAAEVEDPLQSNSADPLPDIPNRVIEEQRYRQRIAVLEDLVRQRRMKLVDNALASVRTTGRATRDEALAILNARLEELAVDDRAIATALQAQEKARPDSVQAIAQRDRNIQSLKDRQAENAAERLRINDLLGSIARQDYDPERPENNPIFTEAGYRDCERHNDLLKCSVAVSIEPGGAAIVRRTVLQQHGSPIVRFDVSFFDQTETPANARGYITLAPASAVPEPPNETTWNVVTSGSLARDPFYETRKAKEDASCPILCASFPYRGGHTNRLAGDGLLKLEQTLGRRAHAFVGIKYKTGNFGGPNEKGLQTDQYYLTVFDKRGTTYRVGKLEFANPTDSLAIMEKGEGYSISLFNYSVAHVIKRESDREDGDADRADRDSDSWIAQARELNIPENRYLRTLSLTYVRGHERQRDALIENGPDTRAVRHKYETVGGELQFSIPQAKLRGVAAFYKSHRTADKTQALCDREICDGNGYAALVRMSWARIVKKEATHIITATWAQGSADDDQTLHEDESYIGEAPEFSPDTIFLSSLAGKISMRDRNDSIAVPLGLGPSVSGKQYIGLQWTTSKFSLMEVIARALFQSPPEEIRSRATKVALHQYRLRNPLHDSSEAGWEADVTFELESPRGVKLSSGAAFFRPGAALEDFVKEDTYALFLRVSVDL